MLAKKLHLKPGMRMAVVNAPRGFAISDMPAGTRQAQKLQRDLDLILLFAVSQKELATHWRKALAAVKQDGALWVAYPKKSSGVPTDLGMGEWEATKGSDWNPVAMIGVDDTWSAARFRHAPGLDEVRASRQQESIEDSDGTVCVDRNKRIVTAPADLQRLLVRNAAARQMFASLSYSHRKEYVVWIIEAKKPETRSARLAKTIEKLVAGRKNPADK